MARPKGSPPREVTKAKILKVAAALFARNGYHGTGIAELADAVGLGRGALYYHIESKETLLFEICGRHVYEMTDFGERILASSLTPTEKFEELSKMLLRTIGDNRDELTVFFREIGSLTGQRRSDLLKIRDRFEDVWQEILNQGIAAGQFRRLDPVIVKGILGMHNYAYLWINPDGRLDPDEISAIFREALLTGVLVSANQESRQDSQ